MRAARLVLNRNTLLGSRPEFGMLAFSGRLAHEHAPYRK